MRIIILFALCRYAQSCAFISVIELPKIPAYCPKEETEAFIGDFYALSSSAGKTIDGENFEAVDISNLYSGQQLTINFQINGICNDQTETMTISFDIDL